MVSLTSSDCIIFTLQALTICAAAVQYILGCIRPSRPVLWCWCTHLQCSANTSVSLAHHSKLLFHPLCCNEIPDKQPQSSNLSWKTVTLGNSTRYIQEKLDFQQSCLCGINNLKGSQQLRGKGHTEETSSLCSPIFTTKNTARLFRQTLV